MENNFDIEQYISYPSGLDKLLNLEYTHIQEDSVQARIHISSNHHQPTGIVHGGVYCSIVESLGSVAGTAWLKGKGYCVGVNNNTNFLKSFRSGTLIGKAAPIHRGRSQQLWEITIADADDIMYALGQLRLHNIYPS